MIHRLYGGGAGMFGGSWSDSDPQTTPDYRRRAGVPDANTGTMVVHGVITPAGERRVKIGPAVAIGGGPIIDAVMEYYFTPPPVPGVDVIPILTEPSIDPSLNGPTIGGGGAQSQG